MDRVVRFKDCKCVSPHRTLVECVLARKVQTHKDVTKRLDTENIYLHILSDSKANGILHPSVIVGSPIVQFIVGKEAKSFYIHKDLLIIHSDLFADELARRGNDHEEPILLDKTKPCPFIVFKRWLYTGEINAYDAWTLPDIVRFEGLWLYGEYIRSPSFQNCCMDTIMQYAERNPHWLSIIDAAVIYKHTKTGSVLRKIVARSMLYLNGQWGSSDYNWHPWFAKTPALMLDMNRALRNIINHAPRTLSYSDRPWSARFRDDYMVDEVPLEVRLERHILSRKAKEDERKTAQNRPSGMECLPAAQITAPNAALDLDQ
jgi:hypothetical protein